MGMNNLSGRLAKRFIEEWGSSRMLLGDPALYFDKQGKQCERAEAITKLTLNHFGGQLYAKNRFPYRLRGWRIVRRDFRSVAILRFPEDKGTVNFVRQPAYWSTP